MTLVRTLNVKTVTNMKESPLNVKNVMSNVKRCYKLEKLHSAK